MPKDARSDVGLWRTIAVLIRALRGRLRGPVRFGKRYWLFPVIAGADDGGGEGGEGDKGGDGGDGDKGKADPPAGKGSGDKELGDAGEKALEAFKKRAREAEKRAKDAEAQVKKFEDKDKSDLERAQSRIAELESTTTGRDTELQELKLEVAIRDEAAKAGITDLRAASKLLDRSKLEHDEDGTPKNLDKVLGELATEYPALVGGAPRTGFDGGTRQPVKSGDMDSLIRRAAGRA